MIPASDNLQATRRQLDDLEALVKKMLELAGGEDPGSKDEDFASQGVFSEEEFLGKPKEKFADSDLPSMKQPEEFSSYQFPEPKPNPAPLVNEEVNSKTAEKDSSQGVSFWRPSNLTWAPLAESWENAKIPPTSSPNDGLESPLPSNVSKEKNGWFSQQESKTELPYRSERFEISPISGTATTISSEHVKKKRRHLWRDLMGFLGIVLIVFAFVLVIMTY